MSVERWVSSPELQRLQQNILSGNVDPGCADCINGELQHGTSTRLGAIDHYGPDPFSDTVIDYVDYRSSNVCNFRCRSCEPYFSNGIAQDVRQSEFLMTLYEIPPNKVATATDKDWIIKNLHNIKRLMFTGGEPTLLPEVRQIVERIRRERLDTQIIMITNGSFQDPYWLEIAGEMPNLNFTVSIDAVGPAAELIRHGTRWAQIERNILHLAKHSHSMNFSTVITQLNFFQLSPLLAFTDIIRKMSDRPNGRTQFIQICNHPRYFSPINWPDYLRPSAVEYLDHLLSIDYLDSAHSILADLRHNIIQHEFDADAWTTAQRVNLELDVLRKQDHAWLFEPAK
jgi:pyruvate-formate lyase-activating enzyme